MITNEQQYQFPKERVAGFKRALAMLNEPDNELKTKNPFMWQFNIEGLHSFLEDYTAQMQEYEELVNRDSERPIAFEINSIEQLPRVLIRARIAAKVSQSELADRLGISEKQLQRYENWEYQEATITQLLEISQVLGIQIQQKATIEVAAPPLTA